MKLANILILLSVILITSCESTSSPNSETTKSEKIIIPTAVSKKLESPQQAQEKLEEKEKSFENECTSANIYLTQKLTVFPIHEKSSKYKVKGVKLKFDIYNAASIAAFENAEFQVKFINKSGSVVKQGVYIINETIEPSTAMIHTLETNITNEEYRGFSSVDVTLVGSDCKKGKGQ